MQEISTLADLFKQYGPMGLSMLLMGAGLVYLLRWLRSEQDRSEAERKEAHEKFALSLEKLGARHETVTQNMVVQITTALEKHGDRIDKLEDRMRGK